MEQPQRIVITKRPPGPPPGRPPILSDNEEISDDEEGNYYSLQFHIIISILEIPSPSKVPPSNGKLIFLKKKFFLKVYF